MDQLIVKVFVFLENQIILTKNSPNGAIFHQKIQFCQTCWENAVESSNFCGSKTCKQTYRAFLNISLAAFLGCLALVSLVSMTWSPCRFPPGPVVLNKSFGEFCSPREMWVYRRDTVAGDMSAVLWCCGTALQHLKCAEVSRVLLCQCHCLMVLFTEAMVLFMTC